jgi:uncharacterized membrane protein/protein-disulfide isomerase
VKANKKIEPLPFPVYYWAVAGTAFLGLADAVYLAISHYRVYTDIGYKSFCAVSKSINCDTVSQSPYSIFLGVPVPVWGVVGYLFFLLLLYPSRNASPKEARLWPTLFTISLCYSLYSIILALISMLYIHSYCIMCIASYAVNFALLYLTWLLHRRFGEKTIIAGLKDDLFYLQEKKKKSAVALIMLIATGILLPQIFPAYWKMSNVPSNTTLSHGTTADGHPWIGAEHAKLVIVEFTDYQCFQCKKMHFYLRELMNSYPDKIKLVHRNFPMDHQYNPIVKEPYHTGSGKLALLALYAAEKNKFWEINDRLYTIDRRTGHFNIRKMARAAGFDVYEFASATRNRALLRRLEEDIITGIKLGVTATPSYLVDGEVYLGNLPANIINKAIE